MALLKAVKTIFYSVFVLIILCGFAKAQNQNNTTPPAAISNQQAEQINSTLEMLKKHPERTEEALDIFEYIFKSDSTNTLLNLKLGASYFKLNKPEKAVKHIYKAWKLDKNLHPDILFYQGWCYQLLNKFKDAEKKYRAFKNAKQAASDLTKEIEQRLKECHAGDSLLNHPADVTVKNLGRKLNTKFEEITPIVNADESSLFFTSRKFNYETQLYYEKIFSSNRKKGLWSRPVQIQFSEDMEVHEAISGLFADALTMFVYQGNINKGDIFYSTYESGKWKDPVDLGKNINTSYHESSACLSPDGQTLYFVSDKPGGLGGRDIYYSNYDTKKNKWGIATNIGAPVNTPFDEEGVYLHPSGRILYFASKGHAGMGGYDIYYSELKVDKRDAQQEKNNWQEPVNVGYPINTSRDNVYASLSSDCKRIYFSSHTNTGFGEKDIYCATFNHKPAVISNMVLITGHLKNETGSALNATIDLYDLQKDIKVGSYKTDAVTGKYTLPLPAGKKYGIVMYSDGYLFESENIDVNDTATYMHYTHQRKMKKMQPGKSTLLHNLFFGKGKSEPLPESINELNRVYNLLKQYPKLKVEIGGYTDNVGGDEFNIKLSEQRAKSIYDYLISKGINEARLTYAGYGKAKPIADNATEDGRSENRRIEFKILGM